MPAPKTMSVVGDPRGHAGASFVVAQLSPLPLNSNQFSEDPAVCYPLVRMFK